MSSRSKAKRRRYRVYRKIRKLTCRLDKTKRKKMGRWLMILVDSVQMLVIVMKG